MLFDFADHNGFFLAEIVQAIGYALHAFGDMLHIHVGALQYLYPLCFLRLLNGYDLFVSGIS